MLESLDRDFEASYVAEELRVLGQAAVRRSASRQGCRWRHDRWGYLWGSRNLVLLEEPRLIHILPNGDERYGIHSGMDDYQEYSPSLSTCLFREHSVV